MRRWLAIAAPVAAAIIGACKGDSATGASVPKTPVGNYSMSTVNTKNVPAAIYSDTGYMLEITAGTLAITVDGKWVAKTTTRETVAGHASTYLDSTFGTWVQGTGGATTAVLTVTDDNSKVNASWDAAGISVVQVDGTLTWTFVYRRQ